MDKLRLVWKVPEDPDINTGDWHEAGIFPKGQLMAVCPSEEVARKHRAYLRDGDTAQYDKDDINWEYRISIRNMIDEDLPWIDTDDEFQ